MLALSCLKMQQQMLCRTALPAHRAAFFTSHALRAATMQHQIFMVNMRHMSTTHSADEEGFAKSTLSPPKQEELKFSSFLKNDKTYLLPKKAESSVQAERFVAKPEFT